MPANAISFSCNQCQKKFSVPAQFAGKQISCTCGNKVTVPSPGASFSAPASSSTSKSSAYQSQAVAKSASVSPSKASAPAQPASSQMPSSTTSHREFPALVTVANVIEVISWIYVAFGLLLCLGGIIWAVSQGNIERFGPQIVACVLGIIVVIIVGIFIRSTAELIRLGLYVATLLEDIRSNTA